MQAKQAAVTCTVKRRDLANVKPIVSDTLISGQPNAAKPQRQLMDAPTLLNTLFAPECRPSLRWIRYQQVSRRIPYMKVGHLVLFDPEEVREHLRLTCSVRANGGAR